MTPTNSPREAAAAPEKGAAAEDAKTSTSLVDSIMADADADAGKAKAKAKAKAKKESTAFSAKTSTSLIASMIAGVKKDEQVYQPALQSEELSFLHPKYWIGTGMTLLDIILGGDQYGLGTGRISELFGANKSAKSELMMCMTERFLVDHPTGLAIVYDQELAMDKKKVESSAILSSCNRWIVTTKPYLERVLGNMQLIMEQYIADKADYPVLFILDSLKSIATKEELGQKFDAEGRMASQARVLSKALPVLNPLLTRANCHIAFTNQTRKNPSRAVFMDDESPGGESLKFFATYRIIHKPSGGFSLAKGPRQSVKGKPPSGFCVKLKTIKNKLDPPDRSVELIVLYHPRGGRRSGLSDLLSIFYTLKNANLIKAKSGGHYYFAGNKDDTFDRNGFFAYADAVGWDDSLSTFQKLQQDNPISNALKTWRDMVYDPDSNFGSAESNDGGDDGDFTSLLEEAGFDD